MDEVAAERARVDVLRRDLGDRLGKYRKAAGVTQRTLGKTLGRTRTMMSRVESGARGMTAEQWAVADEVCGAQGALVAAHGVLAAAEQDYGTHALMQRHAAQRAAAQVEVDALTATPLSHAARLAGMSSDLLEELIQVVTKLVRRLGRRDAIRVAGLTLATIGVSGMDTDECVRVAQALDSPRRVDAQVVRNLASTFAHCRRQEDALGPFGVMETVVAQHGVVRSLLEGGCLEGGLS